MLALNTISYRELSGPLCDSVNRGLTLVRLTSTLFYILELYFDKRFCPKLGWNWRSGSVVHNAKGLQVDRQMADNWANKLSWVSPYNVKPPPPQKKTEKKELPSMLTDV